MGNFIKTQNSFANGEVAPEFYANDNINGLARLENMDVMAGGGLTRRAGLAHIADLPSSGRLIAFSVSESEEYLIILSDKKLDLYTNGNLYATMDTPWENADLDKVQYAQRFGTMIFVHPEYKPYVLQKLGTDFEMHPFTFLRNDSDMTVRMPFVRFPDSDAITISVSSHSLGNNYATFTTNAPFWTPDSVGGRFVVMGRQWLIHQYISPTKVCAYINGTYSAPSAPLANWTEAVFSNRRGWPISITFHQDRLVFGGARDYPSGIWMSRVGQHDDFDVGTGLDDEAIFVNLLSRRRQQICTVISSDNLQILTSTSEWAISSKPLTPSSVDIKQHTSVGSITQRYLPPQKIDGETIFISANQQDIRQLSLDELGEKYNAVDMCLFAKHLMQNPIDIAYNQSLHQLFVVMADGTMAVLNHNSGLGISAWGTYRTNGRFTAVAVVDNKTYAIVERDNMYYLECFSAKCLNDAGKYSFSFIASGLPLRASGHNATTVHVRKITVRLRNTKSATINDTPIVFPNEIYDIKHDGYCGDVSINLLGTMRDCIVFPWTIRGSDNQPITVLSITMHGYYAV